MNESPRPGLDLVVGARDKSLANESPKIGEIYQASYEADEAITVACLLHISVFSSREDG